MSEHPIDSGLPRPIPPQPLIDRLSAAIEEWRERIPWKVVVIAAVSAFAVLWWWMRPEPLHLEPPEELLPLATPVAPPTPTPQTLVVHVAGAVRDPGVLTVLEGTRVGDVIDLAGGLAADADLAQVNLAGLVADGQRLWVPLLGEDEPPVAVGATSPSSGVGEPVGPGAPVNINTATAAELESLPGIGPATAASIVDHRDRNGPFTSLDELLDVSGIGPAKLEGLRSAATT